MRMRRQFPQTQRFISLICAGGLLLAVVGCGDPVRTSDSPTVSLGTQSEILIAGVAGSTTYSVATTNIADATQGIISWYGSPDGSTPASAPAGIGASVTPVSSDAATVTMTASTAAGVGSYYFKLTEGSASSTVSMLTVSPYPSITFDPNGGSGTVLHQIIEIGQSTALAANIFTAPSGRVFAGWTTSITGPGTSYADQASFTMGSSDVTLYAVWLPATMEFESYGNTISINGSSIKPTGALAIPYGVTTIGQYAFQSCPGLRSVTIPSSVTWIRDSAFSLCSSLTSVTIPLSVDSIDNAAFGGCSALTGIVVDADNPNYASVSGILFDKARTTLIEAPGALSEPYTIPSGVATIGSCAFYGCAALTSVTIPPSVATIGIGAFSGCGALASVTISSGVTSIHSLAFEDCSALTSVTIPASVATITGPIFRGCRELTSIAVDADNPSFSSVSGILYDKAQVTLLEVPKAMALGSYIIPSGVTSIQEEAFLGCDAMTSLTIPSSVTSIGLFALSNCQRLSTIYEQAAAPPALGAFNFLMLASGFVIYVPGTSLSAYQSAAGWSEYASNIIGY